MDDLRQDQEVIGNDQDQENSSDELYLVPIYFY
jgi:hypothetical protein